MTTSLDDALTESVDRQALLSPFPGAEDSVGDREQFFRLKYAFDFWLGCLLLVIFSPLILMLFVAVRLTSSGPGFYRQERVGLNGKTFLLVKLRSMKRDAEKPGQAVWACRKDPRVTWLGQVLRTLHLDELPQLWNVVQGDMSLIGPRPERPQFCEKLAQQIDGYYDRVAVKPGVTGLSQINLPPDTSILDARRKQIIDLLYIRQTNAWLEIRILAATALRMIGVRGATVMRWMKLCRLKHVMALAPPAQIGDEDTILRIDSQALTDYWSPAEAPSPPPSTAPRRPR